MLYAVGTKTYSEICDNLIVAYLYLSGFSPILGMGYGPNDTNFWSSSREDQKHMPSLYFVRADITGIERRLKTGSYFLLSNIGRKERAGIKFVTKMFDSLRIPVTVNKYNSNDDFD